METLSEELATSPVHEAKRKDLYLRLHRIRGQVEGLERMIEQGRCCVDVLNQTAAVQEALRAFSRSLMRNYLQSCAPTALRAGDAAEADRLYEELLDQVFKHAR